MDTLSQIPALTAQLQDIAGKIANARWVLSYHQGLLSQIQDPVKREQQRGVVEICERDLIEFQEQFGLVMAQISEVGSNASPTYYSVTAS
jgi:hypothetical protein